MGVDAAISLRGLKLTLETNANGGRLLADMTLRVLAHASAWMNGPSNTRVDIASVTMTGNGTAHGEFKAAFGRSELSVHYEASIQGSVDPKSFDANVGGALGPVVELIIEFLVKTGVVKLHGEYNTRGLLRLTDTLTLPPYSTAQQRVDSTSVAVALTPNQG